MSLSPPPSREKDLTGPAWQKWFSLLHQTISPVATGGKMLWDSISKSGSNLTDIETRNHSSLQNLNSDTASHLTGEQLTGLTGGGKTALHKHDHALQLNLNSVNYTHLTATNHTDLTDGGTTELHKHDFDFVTFPVGNTIGTMTTLYTLSDMMNHMWSAGVVDGGLFTDNGDGTGSLSVAVSTLRPSADPHTTLYGKETAAVASIAFTDDSMNYIYLDYAAGTPVWAVSTSATTANGFDKILAHKVHRQGTVLHYTDVRNQTVDSLRRINILFNAFAKYIHSAGGSVLGSNGLALTLTAGRFFDGTIPLDHIAFDTSVAGTANANVFVLWTIAAGTWTSTENSKLISTTLYNDLTLGPVTLGNNKYGVSWVYIVNDNPSELHVIMGQAEYANISDARVATPPVSMPTIVAGLGVLVGFVVYEKSVTTFDNVYSAFAQAFTPGLATTHNGLSGLQGGTIGEYYHLTAAEYAALGSTAITLATARQVVTLRV